MHASVYRNTRFELATFTQHANSFAVKASERNVHSTSPPELHIPESSFTDEEMAQVHAVLEMLENKFADVKDGHDVGPKALNDQLAKLVEAKRQAELLALEAQRLELENIAKRAEAEQLDAALVAKRLAAAAPEAAPALEASA